MIEQFQVSTNDRGMLRGIINKPDRNGQFPVIIMCHGFTGNKSEAHFLYSKMAREISKLDVVTLRFDFMGSGDSDGEFSEMTYSSEVNDLKCIVEYVKTLKCVDKENINIIGFSMGGAVAITAASQLDEIKNLILLNPACNIFDILSRYINEDSIYDYLENGELDVDGFLINKALVDDCFNINTFEDMKSYKNKTFIIQATNDKAVYPINSIKLKEIGNDVELKFIKGADHCFSTVSYQKEVIEQVTTYVRENLSSKN